MIRPTLLTALLTTLLACVAPARVPQESPPQSVETPVETLQDNEAPVEAPQDVVPPVEPPQEDETPVDATQQEESGDQADAPDADGEVEAAGILEALPPGIAARGGTTEVTFNELDALLLERHGRRPEGIDILNRLVIRGVLEELAAAANVEISNQAINERMTNLDSQMKAEGIEGGLATTLIESDIDPDVFEQMLRLSMIQAELTRLALGLAEGKEPSTGQQNAWMDEILAKRGVNEFTDKFPENDEDVVAESGDAKVTLGVFKERLRNEIASKFVEQACTQLLLGKVLAKQAGEIDKAIWSAAVDKEMQRRREDHAADLQFAGTTITYETMLQAQGLSVAIMREDASVRTTALTTILARREGLANAPEDLPDDTTRDARIRAGMLATYESEREFFDGYFGVRLPLRVCMLRAAPEATELVPRSVKQASDYMTKLVPGITEEAKFIDLVSKISDEVNTKRVGGVLGVYGRGDERLPTGMRSAAWEYFDATPVPGVAGPLEVAGGVALLWVGEPIPAPNKDQMLAIVESELQRRILNNAVPETGIHVFRDR